MAAMKDKAVTLHGEGNNCAQSVLLSAAEYTGMDEKTAAALSAPFGGGMRCGEMCGAVSGALMAVGLCCAGDKDQIAALTQELCAEFKDGFGYLRCSDLKGDRSNCDSYIARAAEIAEEIIKSNK